MAAEGQIRIRYEEIKGSEFADGTTYSLRKPTYTLHDLAYGELDSELMLSLRSQSGYRHGLARSNPEDTILGWADPNDRNADGVSGRPNGVGCLR